MKTIATPAFGEIEEKASKFLCEIVPYQDFEKRLAELKLLHPKANHHVTAIRYLEDGQLFERGKDDGEPSGTSGIPSLRALQGADLVNVGAIVTRYFGGTKLGTGGLARAYAAAVNRAIQAALIVPYVEFAKYEQETTFGEAEKVERFLSRYPEITVERSYTEKGVQFALNAPVDILEEFKEYMDSY
ncbi:MAG: YigZ family protein [Alphaproteobacteria bacterium]|nr:YigZ family protein [Alphaproteobacteria bacterium]